MDLTCSAFSELTSHHLLISEVLKDHSDVMFGLSRATSTLVCHPLHGLMSVLITHAQDATELHEDQSPTH